MNEPPPPISNNGENRASSADLLSAWVLNHLIGNDHQIHQICYAVGRAGALCLSDWSDETSRHAFLAAHAEDVVTPLRVGLADIVGDGDDWVDAYTGSGPLAQFLTRIGIDMQSPLPAQRSKIDAVPAEDLLMAFQRIGVDGLDEIIPAVLHTTGPLPGIDIDWEGLQQSASALFNSGVRWPTVTVSQNGQFGIGELQGISRKVLPPIADPDEEVYFVDERAVFSSARKMTWMQLREEFHGHSED